MSEQELRDELVTLLVAGHETTATALSWSMERLTRMPAGWAALRAGGEEYAEAVAKEALRLRPVLPVVLRSLQRPATIAGIDLPAGAVVAPSIYLVHRRPDVYPDPAAFRPERFLDGSAGKGHAGKFSWIPFGGGVRRCLGASFAQLEMRIALRAILTAVEVDSALEGREGIGRRSITLSPRRGTPISVRPRVREPQVALSA